MRYSILFAPFCAISALAQPVTNQETSDAVDTIRVISTETGIPGHIGQDPHIESLRKANDEIFKVIDDLIPLSPPLVNPHLPLGEDGNLQILTNVMNDIHKVINNLGDHHYHHPIIPPVEKRDVDSEMEAQGDKMKVKHDKQKYKWHAANGKKCKAKCKTGKTCKVKGGPVCEKEFRDEVGGYVEVADAKKRDVQSEMVDEGGDGVKTKIDKHGKETTRKPGEMIRDKGVKTCDLESADMIPDHLKYEGDETARHYDKMEESDKKRKYEWKDEEGKHCKAKCKGDEPCVVKGGDLCEMEFDRY